jgi:molecular chaperone IbpA
MRTILDFTPLMRSTIGFDRVFNLLESASRLQALDNWPPYDIVKVSDDSYRITMAVAGYKEDELDLSYEPNLLVVTGTKSANQGEEYLYRGMADRAFERRFELADYVEVKGAKLENGLLTIDLVRELPEAMKPRRVEIQTGQLPRQADMPQIENQKKAA